MTVVARLTLNKRVLKVYDYVMALPVGPTHNEMKKQTRRYVRGMAEADKQNILSRADEIEEKAAEEFVFRKELLMEVGFSENVAGFYAQFRLNSPGIRTLVEERVQLAQHATPEEIRKINDSVPGVLRGLVELYGVGGLYGRRKAERKT